ncbi:hypothetical protein AM10699_63640 (plasmid) [Acaryochloris marina MBIC10699]|nr:hypothetical protein AM10699_63640 [Acaryochloris marina MBIC10699]
MRSTYGLTGARNFEGMAEGVIAFDVADLGIMGIAEDGITISFRVARLGDLDKADLVLSQ